MTASVRPAAKSDASAWLRMRCDLWPEGSENGHRTEIERFFTGETGEPLEVLLAFDNAIPAGFAELSIRPCAEGCRTDRVAFLEGWYVVPHVRGQGVGRALVEAAEVWAREQGCAEFASDAAPDNEASVRAHRALGFEDAGLVRCFRKTL
jgi:aminoglycoside 6'-N-acetyltransferase I